MKLTLPALFLTVSGAALAAQAPAHPFQVAATTTSTSQPVQAAQPAAPDSIIVYFGSGSAAVRADDAAKLDHAARLFRDAQPIVMEIAGGADAVGSAESNLRLSQKRADAVFHGLVERGIPAARFQILAKGVTDPAVKTDDGVPEEQNRRVQITWR